MRPSNLMRSGPNPMRNFRSASGRLPFGPFTTAPSTALLGGFAITDVRAVSAGGYRVTFTTTYTGRHHQIYAGRTLISYTTNTADTSILAALQPSLWPQVLQLVSVLAINQTTDYGSTLPDRAYNVAQLGWTTSGWTDAKYIEVIAGDAAGDAVNTDNVLENVLFDENRAYSYRTKPLPGSGSWNFEAAGRDDKPQGGNRGTALALQPTGVLSTPPDVVMNTEGRRLSQVTAAGVTTISFTYPGW